MYQYTPLKQKTSTFRFLKLLKGGGGTELECELFSKSLSTMHNAYEALSYTWGSSELVECVTLNRKEFWITDNLYAALKYLRRSDRDRILWIDAICINQNDKEEQSQQVQQMRDIYENANKVLFWLGKATSQITALMCALNQIPVNETGRGPENKTLEDYDWKRHRTAFLQLLSRQWFTRIWILQEAAMSQLSDICCGIWSIPAETFVLASALGLTDGECPSHCRPILEVMAKSFRLRSWWAQERDLRTLLRKFQGSKATDERDKIYALLGMSSNPLDLEEIIIDYRRPTYSIIHEVLTLLFRPTQSLRSEPFAVHEMLNLMDSFATISTTYFVPANMQDATTEVILPHLRTGYILKQHGSNAMSQGIAVIGDPTLFVLDEKQSSTSKDCETCSSQITKLILKARTSQQRYYIDGLRLVPWGSVENHTNVVVINDKKRAILRAALQECHIVVRQILQMGRRDEVEENYEFFALQEAIREGYTQAIQTMIRAGINVNFRDTNSSNALQAAIHQSNEEAIRMLLDAGADVNAQGGDDGNALQAAASLPYDRRNKKYIVEMLLDAGANVNAQGGEHGNALQAAAATVKGNEEVVKALLDAGANVNANGGRYGSALQAAVNRGNEEVVRFLLKAGADLNAPTKDYHDALQTAAAKRSDQIVQMLLDSGANVNAQGGKYGNALQAAAFESNGETVRALLHAGANVNAHGGKYGNALQAAACGGDIRVIQMLLHAGANVNAKGGFYGHALHAADKEDTVRALLDAGADISAKGAQDESVLQAAVARFNAEGIVKMMIAAGADVNTQGGRYGNALQAAIKISPRREMLIDLLLDAGADVNAQGGEYSTALQTAAHWSSERALRKLLDAGADVNAQGGKFGNALQAALSRDPYHESIVYVLIDAGAYLNIQDGTHSKEFQEKLARTLESRNTAPIISSGNRLMIGMY